MSEYDNRPPTLAEMLAETIAFLNIGDDMAETLAQEKGIAYIAGDGVQKDLRRLQQVFIENPHFDAMLYVAAFSKERHTQDVDTNADETIYTRDRFNNGYR